MAQAATAGPEHVRLERAVADPIVNKPILKAVAQPTRPAHDRGPGARAGMMDERYDQTPHSIGRLSAYGETLNAYVFIPVERLAELAAVALSGRVQVVNIVGTRLRYRSGSVQSIYLNTEIEEEEDE